MALVITRATRAELDLCLHVRRRVFIEEQGVSESLDLDGFDGAAIHVLARRDGEPVGTLRLRRCGSRAKIERVAVLAPLRAEGIGRAMMDFVHRLARHEGLEALELHAQVPVIGFYIRLGYRAYGPVFLDANIEHRAMRLEL
ncbi:MAG: GNAT family N-acetyltransferase [Deltaproteobacteria bacterium]|nr:MAG: GNAT family N-acetyltransferase [Deltaproteobacteria bacterium]